MYNLIEMAKNENRKQGRKRTETVHSLSRYLFFLKVNNQRTYTPSQFLHNTSRMGFHYDFFVSLKLRFLTWKMLNYTLRSTCITCVWLPLYLKWA